MDSASAFGGCRAGSGNRVRDGCAGKPWTSWIVGRRADLADEYRNDRERPADRDRRTLRFAFRPCHHFLVELLESEQIRVADLGSSVDFSRAGHAGQGPDAPVIFLWHCAGCSLANEELAAFVSPCAFGRTRNHARHFFRLGCSICQGHDHTADDPQLVDSIQWPVEGHRISFFELGPKYPSGPDLFPALAHFVAVCAIFKISGRQAAATRSCSCLGDGGAVSCGKSCAGGGCSL